MSGCEVRLDDVRRMFGAATAVDGVSLVAPAGRVTVLLGASGSGKSTLLRMIAGLEPVDGGRVLLGGEVVSAPGAAMPTEQRRVGLVFQDYALFPHLTAEANVSFGLVQPDKIARRAEARRWLERVGLGARAGAYPHELSGGEQQRVALARALAPQPRAVLLDEPFSGLDPGLRADLRDVTLAAIAEIGATAIFVTHDADEALTIADQIVILRAGAVVQAGPPRTVYDHPASPEAAAALGPVNRFAGVAAGGAVETPFGAVATSRADGAALVVVRAEAVRLGAGDTVRVLDRRPQGALDLVRIAAGDHEWRVLTAPRTGPQAGDLCGCDIAPWGAFVFDPH